MSRPSQPFAPSQFQNLNSQSSISSQRADLPVIDDEIKNIGGKLNLIINTICEIDPYLEGKLRMEHFDVQVKSSSNGPVSKNDVEKKIGAYVARINNYLSRLLLGTFTGPKDFSETDSFSSKTDLCIRVLVSTLQDLHRKKERLPDVIFDKLKIMICSDFSDKHLVFFVKKYLKFCVKSNGIEPLFDILYYWLVLLDTSDFRSSFPQIMKIFADNDPSVLKDPEFLPFYYKLPEIHNFDELFDILMPENVDGDKNSLWLFIFMIFCIFAPKFFYMIF